MRKDNFINALLAKLYRNEEKDKGWVAIDTTQQIHKHYQHPRPRP